MWLLAMTTGIIKLQLNNKITHTLYFVLNYIEGVFLFKIYSWNINKFIILFYMYKSSC